MAQVSLATLLWASDGRADQLPASAFQTYNAANASSIVAGPYSLFTVPVSELVPTQLNVGFNEVDKKADGFNVVTTPAGMASLTTAMAALENSVNLLSSIEPVVIGPGGVLYQTDGHHTLRALQDSGYGASDTNVYVNVIANFSYLTEQQFLAMMEADNLLFPVSDGTFNPVDLSTGAPLVSSLLDMTSDPYRGLEYSILKNKSSKLFTNSSNITGATGSAIPGLDKVTGFYSDFIWADAYRGANGGLGLPYLSPSDIALATKWNLNGANVTTGLPGFSSLNVNQLPGYILPGNIVITGTVTDALINASGNAELGALAGVTGTFDESTSFASFTGMRSATFGSDGQSVEIGTVQAPGTGPGFVLQLGNDSGGTVTLSGNNTYTGGTTIVAGTLIITSDASLGAAALSNPISLSNITGGVEADNGIIFNSLDEGNGTIQIGTTASPGTNSFTENRPIAVDGEVAAFNLNGNTLTLTGPLYSVGALSTGISNQTGENDITVEDNSSSANGKLVLPSTDNNPNFRGNWNIVSGTLQVSNDASLGATTGPSYEIGQIELNGGTLQAGASFSSVRSLFLQSGSTIDTNGFATSFSGNMQDVQRTLTVANGGAAAGSVSFGSSEFASTAILSIDAGTATSTTGGAGTTVSLGSITRDGNFANAAPEATLFIDPATGSNLGQSGTNGVEVFASGAATTLTNGIAPVWIVTDNGGSAGSNPYNFLTYSSANGYQVATYGDTGAGTTGGLATSTATSVVEQNGNASGASALTGNASAFALKLDNGFTVDAGGHTVTIGDGSDPAGLILEGSTTIQNGTLAFGNSQAVIDSKSTNTINAAITGTGGLVLAGSGTLVLGGTAGGLSGPIDIDSGTLQLNTANFFNTGTTVWLSDVKSKPSNAILQVDANEALSGLDSDGSNSAVNIATGDTLTIGDTTTNYNSTLSSVIKGTGTGSLVKDGSGLLDVSAGGGLSFGSGASVTVKDGALRIGNGIFSTSATTPIVVDAGAELQYSGNGGSAFNDPISGAGIFHLLAGTAKLTGTNTYTGGTVIETGATLDVTPANLPTAGNITNAGGIVDFDTSNTSGGTFGGVISDGIEAGGASDLNDMAAGSCGSNGSSANPQGPACLSGNLIKDDSANDSAGTSNVTLTAQQQYSGFTAIEAGTLTLGAGSSIASSSGVVLGRIGGMTAGSDGGALTVSQTAGLVLGTDSTIKTLSSVPATVGSQVNPNVFVQLAGNTLTIAPPSGFAMTFGGNIQDTGTGSLVLNGAGMEVLDGSNTVGGSTVVENGALQIGDASTPTATLTSPTVTVGAGGTLLGHGTITGAVINTAGGVVQPGGSIGTMTVVGNYTQGSNSTLAIELTPTTSSTLAVTGTASIAGTLELLPDAGTYSRGL
ncbi:MAG TPA: ParB-like protein, partial [Stellaceae bacterium]|nr:ParB-like protein [Stellaceae bacterium]